ncbi:unnamed protein product, partial [marine sediment metagenome]
YRLLTRFFLNRDMPESLIHDLVLSEFILSFVEGVEGTKYE